MTSTHSISHQSSLFHTINPEDFDKFPATQQLSALQRQKILAQQVNTRTIDIFSTRMNDPNGMPRLLTEKYFPYIFPQLPALGLRSRFEEKITDYQFGTLCLLYEAADQFFLNPKLYVNCNQGDQIVTYIAPCSRLVHKFRSHMNESSQGPVIKYQEESEENDRIKIKPWLENFFRIRHAFQDNNQANADRTLGSFFNFSPAEVVQFKGILKNAPPSEHYFYAFPIPPGDTDQWAPMYTKMSRVLNKWKPVNERGNAIDYVPHQTHLESRKLFILPSVSMLQASIQVRYKEHAVTYRVIAGPCSKETIETYKKQRERVLNVAMKEAQVPHRADGNHTGGQLIFSFHDAYHGDRDSMVLNNEKLALDYINEVFKNALLLPSSNPANKKPLKEIKWELIDGELHDSVIRKEKFGVIFHYLTNWNEESKRLVITDLVFRKAVWAGFNLSRNDLYPPEQAIYDEIQTVFQKIASIKEVQFKGPITPEDYQQIKKYDLGRRVSSL